MNRPPSPATPCTKRTRRPGQNLACLAPRPRGAVLLPVIPKIPRSQSRILVKRTDVSGEGGKNFIPHCFLLEVLHPPHRPNQGKQTQLVDLNAEKHRKLKDRNGRERPHFFGFQPPKKFLGSLPPFLCRVRPKPGRGPDPTTPAYRTIRRNTQLSAFQPAVPQLFSCSCDTNFVPNTQQVIRGTNVLSFRCGFK